VRYTSITAVLVHDNTQQLVVPLAEHIDRIGLRTHQANMQPDRVPLTPPREGPIVRHDDHAAIDGVDRDLIVGRRHRAAQTDLGCRDHVVAKTA
jgi:hypothetical protein